MTMVVVVVLSLVVAGAAVVGTLLPVVMSPSGNSILANFSSVRRFLVTEVRRTAVSVTRRWWVRSTSGLTMRAEMPSQAGDCVGELHESRVLDGGVAALAQNH